VVYRLITHRPRTLVFKLAFNPGTIKCEVRARFQAFSNRIDDHDHKARMSRKVAGGSNGSPGCERKWQPFEIFLGGIQSRKRFGQHAR
jgi:hypothetical protein